MKQYICDTCNKQFRQKIDLTRHLHRKKPCINDTKSIAKHCKFVANQIQEKDTDAQQIEIKLLQNKNIIKKTPICKYCNKIFKYKCNLNVHVKNRCNVKKQLDGEKEGILKRLLSEMQLLQQKNKELENKLNQMENKNINHTSKKKIMTNCNNNTQIVNDSVINNNNTFVLVGCGNEDIMKLDKEKIIRAVGAGFYSTHRLTDLVHFDPDHPEYHNVYISNMKDKYAMMYNGTSWILTTKTELIDKLYESKKAFVEGNFDDFCKALI